MAERKQPLSLIDQLKETERQKISAATAVERQWWIQHIITDTNQAMKEGILTIVPNQGENYRLIGLISNGQEPNLARPEVVQLLNLIQSRWQTTTRKAQLDTSDIFLSVTSLYRDQDLQTKLQQQTSLATTEASSHQAGAAIDFDPNGYYQGTELRPINHKSKDFNPALNQALKQVLRELKKEGVCNFVIEKNFRTSTDTVTNQIEEYEACYHVCVRPEAF